MALPLPGSMTASISPASKARSSAVPRTSLAQPLLERGLRIGPGWVGVRSEVLPGSLQVCAAQSEEWQHTDGVAEIADHIRGQPGG